MYMFIPSTYSIMEAINNNTIHTTIWFIIVALVWGTTNPLIKRGAQGMNRINTYNNDGGNGLMMRFMREFMYLVTNWKYVGAFIANQSGSVIYYITLAEADISLAVPITNSLTFIVTAIAGHLLGEETVGIKQVLGMLLVISGVTLCVMSKATN